MKIRLWGIAALLALMVVGDASAKDVIRLGEVDSYNEFPAGIEPYRRGLELAADEINSKGGVIGKKIQIIARDDGGDPGTAVRVANELVNRDGVQLLIGSFLSNAALAIANLAEHKHVFYLAGLPMTNRIVWQDGNKYTFRLMSSTYMQTAMLVSAAAAAHKKRWALVYPNYAYGQTAAANFKQMMKEAQPDVEFVSEQAAPLGKIDAGAVAQVISNAKPDGIFNVLFGADLAEFVRAGETRGIFKGRTVISLLTGEPEYLDPLKDEAPVGWIVTGYPWNKIKTPEMLAFVKAYKAKFHDYPRMGSVVGYTLIKSIAAGLEASKSTSPDKVARAFEGLHVQSPFGPIEYRAIDHQSTLGAFVGRIALEGGSGTMVGFKYVDGASVMPPDAVVKKLRPASANW